MLVAVIDATLLLIVVWSSHLAGVSYELARADAKFRSRAYARSLIAILAAAAMMVRRAACC
jgi:hypothetical protein